VLTILQLPIQHALPVGQPQAVPQIAARLFPAYTVDDGRLHLAGCVLEDRLVARIEGSLGDQSIELYVDAEGRDVDRELIDALGVRETAPLARSPQQAAAQLARLTSEVLPAVQQRFPPEVDFQLRSVTAVWCKYAEGKLRFTFGSASLDLPFAGWARLLEAPPLVCPDSGQQGFHLAATDDGRVTLHERIARCEESGRRVLDSDLVRCSVSGRRVLAELTQTCPVTGKPVLQRLLVPCGLCGQHVSPASVRKDRCPACRSLRRVSKADPRMARLLDEHPALDRWRWWRLAETGQMYVLVAEGWMKQLLVVADKATLELKVLATGNRLLSHWDFTDPAQFERVLRD
jgi:hypothetical protein